MQYGPVVAAVGAVVVSMVVGTVSSKQMHTCRNIILLVLPQDG